jgi:hypothetical protein
VVSVEDDGGPLVGLPACERLVTHPGHSVAAFSPTSHLGMETDDPDLTRAPLTLPIKCERPGRLRMSAGSL